MELDVHEGVPPAAANEREARRSPAMDGVRAIAPLTAGLLPLGLTVGATAARAGLPSLVGWVSSGLLYGASGQLTWMQMLHDGAPAALAVGATVLVNLQMLLYGTAMRASWAGEPRRLRVVMAQLLVGPVFAVATSHHGSEADPQLRRRFYLAAGITLWTAWLGFTGVGYTLGGLPAVPVLALLTPLVMLTLAVRAVADGATLAALIVAATTAVLGIGAPYDLGFVAAGMAGIVTGVIVDARTARRRQLNTESE